MYTDHQQMSAPKAHLELMLLTARARDLPREEFNRRWSCQGLPREFELCFDHLWAETRVCGGELIQLGRVALERILEFVEAFQDYSAPASIGAAVWTLVELAPSLDSLFTPVVLVLEPMGYGLEVYRQDRGRRLMGHAKDEFKHLAVLIEASESFCRELPDMNPDEDYAEESMGYAHREEDNPFLMDDPVTVPDSVDRVVRYLIKMGQSEGSLDTREINFAKKTAQDMGHTLSDEQFGTRAEEVARQSLAEILEGLEDQSASFKENLLFLGMLSAAIDGKVDISEKKLLVESCPYLNISRERYAAISRNALAAIKEMRRKPRFSEDTRITVKFLIKVGLTEGGLHRREREFVRKVVADGSETMTDGEFNALLSETSQPVLDTILADVKTRSTAFREKSPVPGHDLCKPLTVR